MKHVTKTNELLRTAILAHLLLYDRWLLLGHRQNRARSIKQRCLLAAERNRIHSVMSPLLTAINSINSE